LNRFLYNLLLWAIFPLVIFRLVNRGRKQKAYLSHVRERFGHYDFALAGKVVWLHAVSVGEMRAAAPLVEKLIDRGDITLLITCMTPTGRETGEKLYGEKARICYLPYDYPFAMKRFLDRFRPSAGLLMETELWFNLIRICKEKNIPLFLVNARLSEKSLKSYLRFEKLARCALSDLSGIAAQTEQDAQRLTRLGAKRILVCGNLKFDVPPPPDIPDFKAFFDERPVFLAASTREGEEEIILDAFGKRDDILLVIVPRHPQRFVEVEKRLKAKSLDYVKRSENRRVSSGTSVFLGDSLGEMHAYYKACDCAYIGGSLLPFGGQNLIEASSMGKPVFLGPHTYNFEEASQLALEAGAAIRVKDAQELALEVRKLLNEPERLEKMGKAGLLFAAENRGAADRILDLVGI
jgi:3-deoxy-D-manno-octulosonic-acid transferase